MWQCDIASPRHRRACTLPLCFAYDFEVGDGDQAVSTGNERVACHIPIRVIFPASYVEKVASMKCQLLDVGWIGFIIVERFDDLTHHAYRQPTRKVLDFAAKQEKSANLFWRYDGGCRLLR